MSVIRFPRFGRFITASAIVAVVGFAAAGCGQQQAASTASAAPSPSASAAPTAAPTTAATTSDTSNVPLLAVVSPAVEGPCTVNDQYQHGGKVIFRIKVYDPTTGLPLNNQQLSSVNIVLPDHTKLPASYGTHEGGDDPFWVAQWVVPADYPTGAVNFKVSAAIQGSNRSVENVDFGVPDAQAHLTIVPGTTPASKG